MKKKLSKKKQVAIATLLQSFKGLMSLKNPRLPGGYSRMKKSLAKKARSDCDVAAIV